MSENAIHPGRFSNVAKQFKETSDGILNKTAEEEKALASLSGTEPWKILRGKIEGLISSLHMSTTVNSATIAAIEDMELFGFKVCAKDLIVEQLEAIINLVEMNAEFQEELRKKEERLAGKKQSDE